MTRTRRLVIDRPLDPKGRRYAWTCIPDWVVDLDTVGEFLYRGAGTSESFLRDYPDLLDPGVSVEIDDRDIDGRVVSTHRLKIPHDNSVRVVEPDAVRDTVTLLNSGTSVEVPKFSDLFPSGKSYAYDGPPATADAGPDPETVRRNVLRDFEHITAPTRRVHMTAAEEKAIDALAAAWNAVTEALPDRPDLFHAVRDHVHALQMIVMGEVAMRAYPDKFRRG